ncbi:DUF3231 family protein [Paenibacillus sp. GD4]|uniref:DUF3231 family protein n=1 Tax=Paenibacillus sp. GD4 TaxID=3068890 RepID=UPI0027969A7F|nr:DUF3231 family protein [Paenibacillus sp. GD4]MDQ1913278.1 DUF3231 family protein [Paenibacillus sp. GD4]
MEYSLHLSNQHLQVISDILAHEDIPIPHGFDDEDVNINARRLYSDTFFLNYMKDTAKQGLALYAVALALSARSDVRDFFSECLASTTELYNKVAHVMLTKGLYIRPPYIPNAESIEYVHHEGFLNGIFGDKRPLNAMEIAHLFANIQTNALGKALIYGFAQTANSDEVRKYFLRGKEIAHKQIEVFSSYLRDEDLPAPMTWDSDVLDSTDAPFSDKLMLFHICGLNAAGVLNYGTALSFSLRRDLASAYVRLTGEIETFVDDGAELMIKNGWMEKPPGTVDRRVLTAKK